jgi:hypothetical protein
MTDRTDRLDRNGQRRGHPAASAHTTLPPLPSLQEPLYVIPDRKEPLRGKPAVHPPKPKPKAGDKLAKYLWQTPRRRPES